MSTNDAQVLEQYLKADEDEDDAAGEFRHGSGPGAEHAAQVEAATERMKVMPPMRQTAGTMSTLRKAKVTPTASASMLVATASGSMALTPKEALSSSAAPRDSRIMFAPMSASRMKAIQWSKLVMNSSKLEPRK